MKNWTLLLLALVGCNLPDAPEALTDEGPADAELEAALAVAATTGCPISPKTLQPICPPYAGSPAVYFSPHQDDESLGFGGSIKRHLAAGRPVFVELMTRGQATGVRTTLANGATHVWPPTGISHVHNYTLSTTQIADARTKEFLAATSTLGVTGVFLNPYPDGGLTAANVAGRISWWRANATGLSLKGTVSDSYDSAFNPDHKAVWDALTGSGHSDIRGYLVYQFGNHTGRYSATEALSATECSAKKAAHAAYKLWSPSSGRYGIGYHSVKALFDNSAAECKEYLVRP